MTCGGIPYVCSHCERTLSGQRALYCTDLVATVAEVVAEIALARGATIPGARDLGGA